MNHINYINFAVNSDDNEDLRCYVMLCYVMLYVYELFFMCDLEVLNRPERSFSTKHTDVILYKLLYPSVSTWW
jgi:hypothetical protein